MTILGIDVGGSAIKGALVDTEQGALVSERYRIPNDEMLTPKEMTKVVKKIIEHFDYHGAVGIGFPTPIRGDVVQMAANIDKDWEGMNVVQAFSEHTGCPCFVVNDADAAGIAEIRFGVGREDPRHVILMTTLGTGIGTAIFLDGKLLPNCEFGHLEVRGKDAETRASEAIRQRKNLSWKAWAKRLQEFYERMEALMYPDLIIVGGGISKKADQFLPYLKLKADIKPALLLNEAGIIGAACYAAERSGTM